jgi:hypothetical protein
VYSAASASYTAPELSRQVKQGSSNLIFCSEDAKDVAIQSVKDCGVPLSRVLVISSSPEWSMRAVGRQWSLPTFKWQVGLGEDYGSDGAGKQPDLLALLVWDNRSSKRSARAQGMCGFVLILSFKEWNCHIGIS